MSWKDKIPGFGEKKAFLKIYLENVSVILLMRNVKLKKSSNMIALTGWGLAGSSGIP
jgi:hypothetical protein